jgi:hypothetical protein
MRKEDRFYEGFHLKNKKSLSFSFTQSNSVISGVALKKEKGIVASFKLEAKANSSYPKTDQECHNIELKMVFKPAGKKLCTIFDDVFEKYDKNKFTVEKEGYLFSRWRTSYSDARKAIKEAKEVLRQVT